MLLHMMTLNSWHWGEKKRLYNNSIKETCIANITSSQQGETKKDLWRMLTWRHNIHTLSNTQDGYKPRQAVVSFLLTPKLNSLSPSKLPAVHAFCLLSGSSILFSHISQPVLWPFCCWLPPRWLPLFPDMPSCFPLQVQQERGLWTGCPEA